MIDQAADKLRTLLTHMGIEAEVVAEEREDHISLEVKGPETGLVIGKKGATLDAVQYLLNKMLRVGGPAEKPIYVDAERYRERRAESLTELAHRLAARARKTLRPVTADPMSAADRRVIHMALAGSPGLTTRSEGEGAQRRLVIIPDPDHDFGPGEGEA